MKLWKEVFPAALFPKWKPLHPVRQHVFKWFDNCIIKTFRVNNDSIVFLKNLQLSTDSFQQKSCKCYKDEWRSERNKVSVYFRTKNRSSCRRGLGLTANYRKFGQKTFSPNAFIFFEKNWYQKGAIFRVRKIKNYCIFSWSMWAFLWF